MMYFPVGWPKCLKLPNEKQCSGLKYIISNHDRALFAIVTADSVSVWYCKPSVLLCCYTQSALHQQEVGTFDQAEWKADSCMLAVTTTFGYVVFFCVDLDSSVPYRCSLYVQRDSRASGGKQPSNIVTSDEVPAVRLTLVVQVQLSAQVTSLLDVKDELAVSLTDGWLKKIKWDGNVNNNTSVHLQDISLSTDLQFARVNSVQDASVHMISMDYSPLLGGYALVLSNGRGIFLPASNLRSRANSPRGIWAPDLSDAACVAVNHQYRLIAFGCHSGSGMVYSIDDAVGALVISHRLTVSSKDYPDAGQVGGCVRILQWTPDGKAIALGWQKGGFSLWSVFGSLLVCTLGSTSCTYNNYGASEDESIQSPVIVKSMEWGAEGYHLWMACETESERNNHTTCPHLLQYSLVKSALTVNPCMPNHEHLFLQGEDKLFLTTGDMLLNLSSQTQPFREGASGGSGCGGLIGHKQWQLIPISPSYLTPNWPVRYAAIDQTGQCVAVAGRTGLAHYALFTRKWKLFGNETQERSMAVTGGITWWKDFICVGCYNMLDQRDEMRCYPRSCKLDNTFAAVAKVPSQILLLNTFRNLLVVFCADLHFMFYSLERKNTQNNPSLTITKLQEVAIANFIPHPICVTAINLTSLRTESGMKTPEHSDEAESIMLNVAGKLILFQHDHSGPQIKEEEEHNYRPLPFCAPCVVATNVENVWMTARVEGDKKQLMEALWLSCGAQGMKVWLPLFPKGEQKTHNFMSKRIMLPFKVEIYPLAVLFEEAVILGADTDVMSYGPFCPNSQSGALEKLPYYSVERTSQIYLHHILRQLLRRNLGVHALDLAGCCTELPYFPHVLELLLHEVLEAEATTKDPVPDPLLPRVAAFIQEFPEFLQTVVHCARKTEVALWPYLFNTVGNPKDLFEECLVNNQLDTAGSYLIILQNLEKPLVSRQHATMLLDSTLEKGEWELARNMIRFLKAIDPAEAESPPVTPPIRVSSTSSYTPSYPSSPLTPQDVNPFSYGVSRMRNSSGSLTDTKDLGITKEKIRQTKSDAQHVSLRRQNSKHKEEPTADQFFMDVILCRHARKLLSKHRLRDLGAFAGNMEDFHLVSWLRKERLRAAKVEDFVMALHEIHRSFQWPYPISSQTVFQQLVKSMAASNSTASSSRLSEEDLAGMSPPELEVPTTMFKPPGVFKQPPPDLLTGVDISGEVFLKPTLPKEDGSVATVDMSDTSSLQGDSEMPSESSTINDRLSAELEELSHELANKGPHQSEIELRYLLHLMLEAGCLEWALIIAVVLRDIVAVDRTVNTASLTETPIEIVGRMREGLSYIELWADTECIGYKPFLNKLRGQIETLNKIIEQAPSRSHLTSTSSTESGAAAEISMPSSPELDQSAEEESVKTDNEQEEEQPSENCTIS
ncbi:guanine nucleotide exchange factor subunit RIC1-like isoform X2 [Liolophura sinensis]|uniref:guanine nucleotide exchange factor subunit RIC1-like isoform X2 n=1 Tax=Liolophura sinensis TaxID=3198878 RepID=UPI00315936D8